MLYFGDGEMEPIRASTSGKCEICDVRPATWKTPRKRVNEDEAEPVVKACAWCVLYSGKTQWGEENKDELLHSGRLCQGIAAEYRKPLPALDDRGRLHPPDAERYMMGIAATSRMIVRGHIGRLAAKMGKVLDDGS